MKMITSRQNPRFKEIKKLIEDKKFRDKTNSFFVDGVNFVASAIENGWTIRELVYVPEKIDTEFKKKIINLIPTDRRLAIDLNLFETLATKKDIQGVGAVVEMRKSQNKFLAGTGVVLENIANPGNLGSIARLCAAFDIKNLYVIKPAVDLFHPEAVRSSMGAIFYLDLVNFDSLEVAMAELTKQPRLSLGTSLQDDSIGLAEYKSNKNQTKVELFWFGAEAKGLTSGARSLCQSLVKIPISRAVDSLNVAESAAIVLYELKLMK